jgi:hypothetical protein
VLIRTHGYKEEPNNYQYNSMGKIGPTGIFGYMQDSALRDRKGSIFSY